MNIIFTFFILLIELTDNERTLEPNLENNKAILVTNFDASNSSNVINFFQILFSKLDISKVLNMHDTNNQIINIYDRNLLRNKLLLISKHLESNLSRIAKPHCNFSCKKDTETIDSLFETKRQITTNPDYQSDIFIEHIIKYNLALGDYIINNENLNGEKRKKLTNLRYMLDFASLYTCKKDVFSFNNIEKLVIRYIIEKKTSSPVQNFLVPESVDAYELINKGKYSNDKLNTLIEKINDEITHVNNFYIIKWIDPIFELYVFTTDFKIEKIPKCKEANDFYETLIKEIKTKNSEMLNIRIQNDLDQAVYKEIAELIFIVNIPNMKSTDITFCSIF
ncbi:hypothetical protein COBT_001999 [Conglomerata obtusa]